MKIFKYPLGSFSEQQVEMPKATKILSCKLQNKVPTIWALVDEKTTEKEVHLIQIIGTGHEAERVAFSTFVDTFLIDNDSLVFHVFDSVLTPNKE